MIENTCLTNHERLIELSIAEKTLDASRSVNFNATKIPATSLKDIFPNYNYSPIIWTGGNRKQANFRSVTAFCVDIDATMSIDDAKEILSRENLNYALVTTKTHKPDSHRFRIFLPFERPVYTVAHYQWVAQKINELFRNKCDPSVFDGARFFFYSPQNAEYFDNWSGNDFSVEKSLINFKGVDTGDWNDNLVVIDSNRKELPVFEIETKTQIYCPFHNDEHTSAFIDFSEKSDNWYIYCSACNKTYWQACDPPTWSDRSTAYWSHLDKIYEVGMNDKVFYFNLFGSQKFYSALGAHKPEEKRAAFDWLVKNKHISCLQRIDYLGDASLEQHTFEVKKNKGCIEVRYAPIAVDIQDNDFIENYLDATFGPYKDFIKQYLAVYTYTNYRKLPTLILVGKRSVGKNLFAEMVGEIYRSLSQPWKGEESNFNPEVYKKLLIADERVSKSRENYLLLKRLSGESSHEVNEKFKPQYMVKNNLNIIILSNSLLPIFVEREEFPTDSGNNQFFVFQMKRFSGRTDTLLNEKLKARLGHYVRSELRKVFESLDTSSYRYGIPVPITPDEAKLFSSSVSMEETLADKFLQEMIARYSDGLPWDLREFITAGYVPVDKVCREFGFTIHNKKAIVRNLQERDFLISDDVKRPKIGELREYCYVMTDKLKDKIEEDIDDVCFVRPKSEEQTQKAA